MALRRFLWNHGEFTAEEEDSGEVVFEVPEAAGVSLDRLDLRIDSFREGIGDVAVEIGEDIVEMLSEHPCYFPHFFYSRTGNLLLPLLEIPLCIFLVSAIPKVLEKFFEIPCFGDL